MARLTLSQTIAIKKDQSRLNFGEKRSEYLLSGLLWRIGVFITERFCSHFCKQRLSKAEKRCGWDLWIIVFSLEYHKHLWILLDFIKA